MANIDRLVDVQISLNTAGIAVSNFSDMIFVAPHVLSLSRVMAVTAADQLLDLGARPSDAVYRAAQAFFSQGRHPAKLFVGRRQAKSVAVSVDKAVKGAEYRLTVAWKDGADTVTRSVSLTAADETPAQIAQSLQTALAGISGAQAEAALSGNVLTVSHKTGGAFTVKTGANMSIGAAQSDEDWADVLAAIRRESNDWYGLAIYSREEADVLAAAAWAETNHKLFGTASSAANITDGSADNDLLSRLKTKGYAYTFALYHTQAAAEYPEAALMAERFTYYPGSETWANVKLNGITADKLPEGDVLTVQNKNGSTFETFGSFAVSQGGKTAAGEWIDVIRFRDWLKATMQADVAFALINAGGKIPYTDKGIQIIANAMQQSLALGVRRGGIAEEELDENNNVIPSYRITYPKASEISPNRKASRVLQDIGGAARLAGAVHLVEIKFALSYAL